MIGWVSKKARRKSYQKWTENFFRKDVSLESGIFRQKRTKHRKHFSWWTLYVEVHRSGRWVIFCVSLAFWIGDEFHSGKGSLSMRMSEWMKVRKRMIARENDIERERERANGGGGKTSRNVMSEKDWNVRCLRFNVWSDTWRDRSFNTSSNVSLSRNTSSSSSSESEVLIPIQIVYYLFTTWEWFERFILLLGQTAIRTRWQAHISLPFLFSHQKAYEWKGETRFHSWLWQWQ